MSYHNGLGFTTKDKEHDTWEGKNCATHYRGGWWFANCHRVRQRLVISQLSQGKAAACGYASVTSRTAAVGSANIQSPAVATQHPRWSLFSVSISVVGGRQTTK